MSIILIVVLLVLSVILGLSLYFGFTSIISKDVTGLDREYRLTDRVLYAYRGDFCESILATSTRAETNSNSNATLYMLKSRPPASEVERFNWSDKENLKTKQWYSWRFYLNTGSNVSFNACVSASGHSPSVTFYLVKGDSNYNAWQKSQFTDSATYLMTKDVSSCLAIPQYTIHGDDRYFFNFYSDEDYRIHLSVDYQFQRTVYHITPNNVIEKCFLSLNGHSSCSVGVPLSSRYTALLSLNTTPPINYTDGAYVKLSCQPRNWFYAVVGVCGFIPIVFFIILVLVCMCIRARRAKSNYYKMMEENTTVARPKEVSGTADVAPGANHPPSYNRLYPSLHINNNGYGAVSSSAINSNRQ